MLGETFQLADNLWYVQGEMPSNVDDAPDWCNVVVYRAGDRLYLIDSSGGPVMRAAISAVLQQMGPVESFTLINTHSHLDHICNNDLIGSVQATTKHHYLLRAGMEPAMLDAPSYFAEQFDQMDTYYDPFTGYPVNQLTYRMAGLIRDGLGALVGRRRVLRWLFGVQFKKFAPVNASRQTMEALDDLPSEPIDIGGTSWNGWRLGDDDIQVMATRAHANHDLVVYIPEHRLLCLGDITFPLFPTWADSSRQRIIDTLTKSRAMVDADALDLLADGHGDRCYRGRAEISHLLDTVVNDHLAFEEIIRQQIFATRDGLTPGEIYQALLALSGNPVVDRYLELEFPRTPASLQNIMVSTMLQQGYQAEGRHRKMRFYRPPEPVTAREAT